MLRLPPEEALGLGPGTLLGVGDGWTSVCHIFCIHSSIHLLTSALSLTSLGICAFTSSFVHLFHNLPTHLFIYLLVHSSTCSVIYSFLGSVAYLATQLGSDLNVGCSPSGLGIAPVSINFRTQSCGRHQVFPRGVLPPYSFQVPAGIGGCLYILLACGQLACPSSHMDLGSGLATVWGAQPSSIPTTSLVKPHDPPIFSSPMERGF